MKNKLSKVLASGVTLLSFPIATFASFWDDISRKLNQGSSKTGEDLIVDVLNWMIGAAAVICVVMLIVGGYSYMTAGGDEQKVGKATKTLTNAMIGLAICFIAVILVNFVLKNFLGVQPAESLLMTFLA
jgi:hypothetical protein